MNQMNIRLLRVDYLWGQVSFKQTSNLFVTYGLIVIGVAVLAYLAFYKVIDHPNFNRWRSRSSEWKTYRCIDR